MISILSAIHGLRCRAGRRPGRFLLASLIGLAASFVPGSTRADPASAFAAQATDKAWDGSAPPQGIYFHWYEPVSYTHLTLPTILRV